MFHIIERLHINLIYTFLFIHFCKQKLQDDAIKDILKRARNVKEVFFDFWPLPSIQIIELLPDSLEHLQFLELQDDEQYSGKFRRLKSLTFRDNRFDL